MKLPIDGKRTLRFTSPAGQPVASDPLLELELIKLHPLVAEISAAFPGARVSLAPAAPPPQPEEELNDDQE